MDQKPKPLDVIVCGSRHGMQDDSDVPGIAVARALSLFERHVSPIASVIVGGLQGVDGEAARWAVGREFPVTIVPAQWSAYGRAAGPMRNELMADSFQVDAVLALPGGQGTSSMIRVALLRNITVWRYSGGAENWKWTRVT